MNAEPYVSNIELVVERMFFIETGSCLPFSGCVRETLHGIVDSYLYRARMGLIKQAGHGCEYAGGLARASLLGGWSI